MQISAIMDTNKDKQLWLAQFESEGHLVEDFLTLGFEPVIIQTATEPYNSFIPSGYTFVEIGFLGMTYAGMMYGGKMIPGTWQEYFPHSQEGISNG